MSPKNTPNPGKDYGQTPIAKAIVLPGNTKGQTPIAKVTASPPPAKPDEAGSEPQGRSRGSGEVVSG